MVISLLGTISSPSCIVPHAEPSRPLDGSAFFIQTASNLYIAITSYVVLASLNTVYAQCYLAKKIRMTHTKAPKINATHLSAWLMKSLAGLLSYIFIMIGVSIVSLPTYAQTELAQNSQQSRDPQQQALEIFNSLRQQLPPETIAMRLESFVQLYRYGCDHIGSYQVFLDRPNLIDIKVKCTGQPIYGISIAANGYGAVYGGNGMVRSFDPRDGLIYTFAPDGNLASTSRMSIIDAVQESSKRAALDGEDDKLSFVVMAMLTAASIFVIVAFGLRITRRQRRRKRSKRKPHSGLSPILPMGSDQKDQLLDASEMLKKGLYKHPEGFYIAIGPRGKRRVFAFRLWASLYRRYGWKMFERIRVGVHTDYHGPGEIIHDDTPEAHPAEEGKKANDLVNKDGSADANLDQKAG